jgi:hypothetical protein
MNPTNEMVTKERSILKRQMFDKVERFLFKLTSCEQSVK